MSIIMGGSGSTGSSLLKNILSRHSKIFAGRETSLFSKYELYANFERSKWRIPYRFPLGLRNHSYHMYNGIDYNYKEYLMSQVDLQKFVRTSESFQEFSFNFFSKSLRHFSKELWMEKTPSNAYLFDEFLSTFNDAKTIHTVRNPYDTIYSMMRRGYSLIKSATTYLMNTAAGLRVIDHPNSNIVHYEDLINRPEQCVRSICQFLGIAFDDVMLSASNPYNISEGEVPSWNADEFSLIQSNYNEIPQILYNDINFLIHHLSISQRAKEYFKLNIRSIPEICTLLNYELRPLLIEFQDFKGLKTQLFKDKWSRIKKLYPWSFYNMVEII